MDKINGYKVSIKYYLNTKLKPKIRQGIEKFRVYIQLVYRRKNIHFKSRIMPFVSKEDFELFERGTLNDVIQKLKGLEKDIIFEIIKRLDSGQNGEFSFQYFPDFYNNSTENIMSVLYDYMELRRKQYFENEAISLQNGKILINDNTLEITKIMQIIMSRFPIILNFEWYKNIDNIQNSVKEFISNYRYSSLKEDFMNKFSDADIQEVMSIIFKIVEGQIVSLNDKEE